MERDSIIIMNSIKRLVTLAILMPLALPLAARAQESGSTPAPTAAPAAPASERLTPMDVKYDGKTHVSITPYVWLPTFGGNFHYHVPTLPAAGGGGSSSIDVSVPPSQYLTKLNAAAMIDFDVRKGNVDLFGDFINVNLNATSTRIGNVSGPGGKIQIPIDLGSDTHLASSIWEVAAGLTLARGHNADMEIFGGWRQFPIHTTLSYNLNLGKKGFISRNGSVTNTAIAGDAVFGLRGSAYIGDSRFFVPYYVDIGVGSNNQSWQALGGAGYTFNHGQSILLTWRQLDYNAFPADYTVQKLTMGGPLLGYTMHL
jgi:hypothetical protein